MCGRLNCSFLLSYCLLSPLLGGRGALVSLSPNLAISGTIFECLSSLPRSQESALLILDLASHRLLLPCVPFLANYPNVVILANSIDTSFFYWTRSFASSLRFDMANVNALLYSVASFIAGLFLLEYGADKFVDHTAVVAKRLNVSPTLVGLLTCGAEWEEVTSDPTSPPRLPADRR